MRKKIKQLFCKHKNTVYMVKRSKYSNIQGETVYEFCEDCGKKLGSEFLTWDEYFTRFRS